MNIDNYRAKLEGKTFIFKVGSFNNIGGAETKAITVAEILKNDIGADVVFLANGGNGALKDVLHDKGFETFVFPYKRHAKHFSKATQIVKQILFLRKLKPDFILPWSSDNCKSILPFWRYTGAKYAWWNMQDEGRGLYKTKNEERLMKEASDIISNSIAGENFIVENYDITRDEVVLYNNPTYLFDGSRLKPIWRAKLNLSPETLVVSMFANITYWKDHKTLVKAWYDVVAHFRAKNSDIKLVLAGDCREATDELKIMAFDLNLSDSIIFIGSVLEVNELMMESDLVVHSSNTEGCPNAVCEAMALGKPVVATDIPGDREALSDRYETYTLTKPNDPKDLAEKLIYMLEHKELAAEIGAYNKGRIATHYTLEGMIDTLFSRFIKVI